MITKHLIVTGRVQGVGYRNYMVFKAHQFHITGWVRNRTDGCVEAVIQGTPENVEALIARAQRGPPHAVVSGVTVSDATGAYEDFVINVTV
jgi:acylphosphatase